MINIRTALTQALHQLAPFVADARMETELLLCHALNKNKAYLYAHPEQIISVIEWTVYQQLINQRANGMPIAYITGMREFWSLTLKVDQHTLIPRHETERLVELALELTLNEPDTHILDLGTGSGAIALALAKERPNWKITACDYNEKALTVAKKNAQNIGINTINFYHSNWFNAVPNLKYHSIISNPPYIAEDDPHLKQGDLRFEPLNALASSQDGLADLQYIINHASNYLVPNGLLLLEHGYDQKNAVQAILKKLGYNYVQSWQDTQGHDRVSGGRLPI